ncbi:DegT/DnrJ/EryC1/StrS family aminotransferase [Candidatus Parcubacteria bacterium]|nr:MAG: DegT/DnrJ/EryC1/StrS family aminotransferase [Candidatus Parcubacteria bacterium]
MTYIPFHKPHLPNSTYPAVKKVFDSGWLTTGPNVKIFENKFTEVIKSQHAIAVSSCTAALHLAYLAHKFSPGDEIIVPSYTFVSTVNAIVHAGAKPVFCDIDENTLCIDPVDIEKRITKKTKGIVVVHFAGMPADMDKINNIANKHKLIIIEDAAHAFMTSYKGKYIGESDNTVCFSFYATKNLTTIEGGIITTNDEEIATFSKIMSLHGISKNAWKRYSKEGSWKYDVIAPGYKYNMTDIQAVIGIEQLKHVRESVRKRQHLSSLYKKYLKNNSSIILPIDPPYPDSQHAWHLFTIRLTEKSKVNRDTLIELLKENEIGTSVHFIPNHLQSYYRTILDNTIHLPITEKVFDSIISLPFFEDLTEPQIKKVCRIINKLTI